MKQPHHLRDASGEVLLREEERQHCENWSRVCGYLRPIRTMDGQVMWNAGKVSEFRDRKTFTVTDAQRMGV